MTEQQQPAQRRTTTEAELREMVAKGMTRAAIARELNRRESYVSAACALLGISGQRRGGVRKFKGETYLVGLRQGKTLAQIGADFGVTETAIFQALKRAGLPTSARALLRSEALKQTGA